MWTSTVVETIVGYRKCINEDGRVWSGWLDKPGIGLHLKQILFGRKLIFIRFGYKELLSYIKFSRGGFKKCLN